MRDKLIACFQDTLNRCAQGELARRTQAAANASVVYPENFVSGRLHPVRELTVQVVEGTAFDTARENLGYGRVAVLNFANPHYPGGAVAQGVMAQEECLCRSSNLYPCLAGEAMAAGFYRYHQTQTDYDFSDRMICTPNVTVFKDDSPVPVARQEEDWFQVDVITCAAPYLAKRRHVNRTVLLELFVKRIRGILEAALDLEAEVLILGAFGCGAFGNPPEVVAGAFHQLLKERRYQTAFSRVIFAIKSSVGGDAYTVCPNLAAFQLEFFGTSSEMEKLRYVGGPQKDPGALDVVLPGGRVRYRGSESRAYYQWREKNPYFGKKFSIVGDSISTLEGFNPRGNALFYDGASRSRTGIWEMADTWWGKVIDFFGGELLVNDSWSGCWVARPESRREQFPSACSDRRTGRLHGGSVQPDVILVYLGTNDWANGVALQPTDGVDLESADTYFALAYGLMLNKLRRNYPQAEIWCMTLARTKISTNPGFRFPEAYAGIHMQEYNHQITNAALANGCAVADIYSQGVLLDTLDGTHPNPQGMDTLAMLMVRQMADAKGGDLLDCELTHDCVDGICRRCGKPMPQQRRNSLRLRLRSSGQVLTCDRWQVTLGRSRDCDLVLTNLYVARSQATFHCRDGSWYLRDNDTRNGTYLNGTRLQQELEYPIHPGDLISFAKKEEAEVL